VTIIVLSPVCRNLFVEFDDGDYVTHNRHVQAGVTGEGLRWAWTSREAGNWHPLTWHSLQLDAEFYALEPFGYHLTNLLLHVANTVLLFWVLWRMTGLQWQSAFAAALFGWHPLHVESVAWVAERKDVLSTLFFLLTLLAYVRYAERPGVGRYLVVATALGLGLLAKPMLVSVPFLLLLLDFWPLGRYRLDSTGESPRRLVVEKLPLLGLALASSAITLMAQQPAMHSLHKLPVGVRTANAVVAYVEYIGMMLWPGRLAAFYPHPGSSLPLWHAAAAAMVLVLLTVLAVRNARCRPYALVGWLWYVVTLVPVIGLVQVGRQAMADRYTYIPLVGLFVVASWAAAEVVARMRVRPAAVTLAAVMVLGACALGSWLQVGYWRDAFTLWDHALAVTADNYLAHYNLAGVLDRQRKEEAAHGDRAGAARKEEDARRHYVRALEIFPNYPDAHDNLGLILERRGHLGEAMEHYAAAMRADPANGYAPNDLGQAFIRQGNLEEAARCFTLAVQAKPDFALAQDNLGFAMCLQGKPAEALVHFQEAVRLQGDSAKFRRDLAHALWTLGQEEAAREHYQLALELEPDWPEAVNRAAWPLATQSGPGTCLTWLAVHLAEQACEVTDRRHADFLDTLAAAYAAAGHFDKARDAERRALERMPVGLAAERAAAMQARLRLYEQDRPFRAVPGATAKWAPAP
jgi:tetratricopeptide (TPR) repeat protein